MGKCISISIARRRKLPQRLMAELMPVSVQTLQRLEANDATVGLAVLQVPSAWPSLTLAIPTGQVSAKT